MVENLYTVPKGREGTLQNCLFYPYRVPIGTVVANHRGGNFASGIIQIPSRLILGQEFLADFSK